MKFFNHKLLFFCSLFLKLFSIPHYYCTPADSKHFGWVKNLIGSIHRADFVNLGEIAVFDLGFEIKQRNELTRMAKVKVYDVEMTHPDLLKPLKTAPGGRMVRGYFAWKPVVIKQALERFSYVLYLDAGTTVLKSLDNLFEHIVEQGYFLLSCTKNENCNQVNRITQTVIDKVLSKRSLEDQVLILSPNSYHIDAGLQGVSRKMLDDYIFPMHQHSKDLGLFKDDGTAKFGYGAARHDQTLFSIYAYCLKLKINDEGWINLSVGGRTIPVHIHWDKKVLNKDSVIYRSRGDTKFEGGKTRFIR